MLIALQTTVEIGFVLGMIDPITPYGAYSTTVNPPSPLQAPVASSSLPGALLALRRIFSTLSSKRPMPVSVQAS